MKTKVEHVGEPEFAERALAGERRFEAVITDLHLGTETAGWQDAERALDNDPDVVVFVVSGHLPEISPLGNRYGNRLRLSDKPLTLDTLSGESSNRLKH